MGAFFEHVIVMRTDVILTRSLDVGETCKNSDGLNIISGDEKISCGLHNRDTELAQLACQPKFVQEYFAPRGVDCQKDWHGCKNLTGPPPPLPKEFFGSWDICDEPGVGGC